VNSLTRQTWTGPWAGLPVAWTEDDRFDETAYRSDIAAVLEAGAPGVYTGGSTGEFFAMEFEEFQAVARATIEECHAHGKPATIGCTSTFTKGAQRRAAFAAEAGADAIQIGFPFWQVLADWEVAPFVRDVSAAAGGLPLSVYDTARSKRVLRVEEHRAIRDGVPNYLMVKSTGGTAGATPEGCAQLSGFLNVFVSEHLWGALGPVGARGACSAMVYWNPRVVLDLWRLVEEQDWKSLEAKLEPVGALHRFLAETFGPKGFTDTAYDRTGGRATGFLKTSLRCRRPYSSPTEEDVEILRRWFREHFPDMLDHESQGR
jgi:dihydrodipicolinate synthase/N-acetylneuraminate lyase